MNGARSQEGSNRPERNKVTNDPVSYVLFLAPAPCYPEGVRTFPRHHMGAEWRKWNIPGTR